MREIQVLPKYYAPRGVVPSGELHSVSRLRRTYGWVEIAGKEISSEKYQDSLALLTFQRDWITNQLGLDVKNRLSIYARPTHSNIQNSLKQRLQLHEYPDEWEFVKMLKADTAADSFAFTDYSSQHMQMHVADLHDADRFLHDFGHEHIHVISGYRLQMEQETPPKKGLVVNGILHTGYGSTRSGTFSLFTEVVTELLNIEMLEAYRQSPQGKDVVSPASGIGYHAPVMVFDALLQEAAQRVGRSYKEIRYQLYKGLFTADMSALRIFTEAFGKEGIARIAAVSLDIFDTYASMHSFIEQFGISPELLKEKVNAYQNQKPVAILDSVMLKRKKTE